VLEFYEIQKIRTVIAIIQGGPTKYAVVLRVITSSVMNQFKEIPLVESLLYFPKDACNNCYIPSECYYLTSKMANNVGLRRIWSFANHGVKHSDKYVHRIVNYIEQ